MSSPTDVTPLLLHTLDSLCVELVSGRGVSLSDGESVFRLASKEARTIFEWYRNNREKWAGQNRKEDVEAIAAEIAKDPPVLPSVGVGDTESVRGVVHLKRVRAHRFAGLHRYGTPDEPPSDFEFEFESAPSPGIHIIEGKNGVGKTCLLSAITWCLTGQIYRSQRPPETVESPVEVIAADAGEEQEQSAASHAVAAITPLPRSDVLRRLGTQPVPLDTWVELDFVDDNGNEVGTVRRSISRSGRGRRIDIAVSGLSDLGLPPIALEIGTRMTGLLPYVQVGSESALGSAVAELTGIRPLRDLVKHARKSEQKLRRELPRDRDREIDELDRSFSEERQELAQLLQRHPELAAESPVPEHPAQDNCEEAVNLLKEHFEANQARVLAGAEVVLGLSFDASDKRAVDDLARSIPLAIDVVSPGRIAGLEDARRLQRLGQLTEDQLEQSELLLESLLREAEEISQLEQRKDDASRVRLYAKVAGWLREQDVGAEEIADCPVCDTSLEGKIDPKTNKPIAEHIRELLLRESTHLELIVSAWIRQSLDRLKATLPETLGAELSRTLPGRPHELISAALTAELFRNSAFSGTLKVLKGCVETLCAVHLENMPVFTEPEVDDLPDSLRSAGEELTEAIRGTRRAIAFARWRQENADACKEAFLRIIGVHDTVPKVSEKEEGGLGDHPLRARLVLLKTVVENSEPLRTALERVGRMAQALAKRRRCEEQQRQYAVAANAIVDLFRLDELVDRYVGALMRSLSADTAEWKKALYLPPCTDAPSIAHTDVQDGGTLVIEAESQGSRAPAQHICNASDLRATLLAFVFAFWKQLVDDRGGLSLLLLDDLQELFDPDNRRRVASCIPDIVKEGAHVVLTTNDREFGRRVNDRSRQKLGHQQTDRRELLPAKSSNLCAKLSRFHEAIEARRKTFGDRPNDHDAARSYVNELRIYLEDRLSNLFDTADPRLGPMSGLSDLVNAVRRRIASGVEPFTGRVFEQLADDPAFRDGSPFLELMNQAHHRGAQLVTYNAVNEVRDECRRALDLVHSADEEYERWLRREPATPVESRPDPPAALERLSFSVPLVLATAAARSDSPLYTVETSEEPLACDWLTNHAIYVNTTDNLGFAGSKNCRVIVDLNDAEPDNHSLVVALHGDAAYVRRFHRYGEDAGRIGLASEAGDPRNRPPPMLLRREEVCLLRVVGLLFDRRPVYPRQRNEAVLDEQCRLLGDAKLALKVRGESALPLVLEGQMILAGDELLPGQLDSMEGELVAIVTDQGTAFKRLGAALAGAEHVRQFESIGGLGESLVVRVEQMDDDPFHHLPLLEAVRLIIGILYDPTG